MIPNTQRYWKKLMTSNYTPWVIMVIGALLRLRSYFYNKSLWADEAALAVNIVERSYSQLIKPLEYIVYAPIGYLWIEKTVTRVLGTSELSLRLFPFICSLVSVFFFYKIASIFLSRTAALMTLALFALIYPLIYYASEVKQYSSDICVSILLYFTALYCTKHKPLTNRNIFILITVGVISVWLSFSALYTVTAIGLVLFAQSLYDRNKHLAAQYLFICFFWAVNLIINYYTVLRQSIADPKLLSQLSSLYSPSLLSWEFVKWFQAAWLNLFQIDLNMEVPFTLIPGILFFLMGIVYFHKKNKYHFMMLVLPLLFTFVAAILHKYIFYQRLTLFLLPSALLIIGAGIEQLFIAVRHLRWVWPKVMAGCVITLLFAYPAYNATVTFINPTDNEPMRPVVEYISDHSTNHDVIYIYYASQYAYRYYARRYGLNDLKSVVGIDRTTQLTKYMRDLSKLSGHSRVWILISHNYNWGEIDEKQFFLTYLNSVGKLEDSYELGDAGAYLFNLSSKD